MGFWRNGFVTLASVLVMTVTLFAIGSLVFSNALVQKSLDDLQSKVDINAYFTLNASEEDILDLQRQVDALPEVASTEYVSRDDALERFRARHQDDQLVLQSLDELEENPLPASLAIRAKDPSQYQSVADFLKTVQDERISSNTPLIDNINFFQNQETFENLANIIDSSERANFV
ncbi:MAG: permease-like cell division protein FtsX, partial [Candidatus Paceibacterota bacterium]